MQPSTISDIFARLDPPLWLVTAQAGPRRGGLIASVVNQASITAECPRVLVNLAAQHYTWDLVEQSGRFVLHLLGEGQLDWVWHFGLRTGRGGDKLAGLPLGTTSSGSPCLPDALAWLDCRVEAKLFVGDRTVYVAEVVEARQLREGQPLTAKRMVELAPPERLAQLREQMAKDQSVDAAAIRAWRGTCNRG